MDIPNDIKLFHIVHMDRIPSIMVDGFIWSDEEARKRTSAGTTVGMSEIKERRLHSTLTSHPNLTVGQCVPFYFCPRSIMLYMLHKGNHEKLTYRGGQRPIIHLVVDMHAAIEWADRNSVRWAFTLSNAGSRYFEDRNDLADLGEVDWESVNTRKWSGNGVDTSVKEGKQAEFLIEHRLPWELVNEIGVYSNEIGSQLMRSMPDGQTRPTVKSRLSWYY